MLKALRESRRYQFFATIMVYVVSLYVDFWWDEYTYALLPIHTFLFITSIFLLYLLKYPSRFLGTLIFVYWFLANLTAINILVGFTFERIVFLVFVYGLMFLIILDEYGKIRTTYTKSHNTKN